MGAAKRVRTETGVSRGAANVSSVAVELAKHVFVDLAGKTVLVIGAGKMSALAARHLHSAGAGTILVTNRSADKAEKLADEIDGVPRPWDNLSSLLTLADVVISSTGSRQPVLTPKLLKQAMKARRYRSIVIIDIAVPRDADPKIGRLDGVYLFDIDDLQRVVAANLEERAKEAENALDIVGDEVGQFDKWLRSQRVVPTIRSLRDHFIKVAQAEVDRTLEALDRESSKKDREKAIRRLGTTIVNKLLHAPLTALKAGDQDETEALVAATQRLFPLERADGGSADGGSAGGRSVDPGQKAAESKKGTGKRSEPRDSDRRASSG